MVVAADFSLDDAYVVTAGRDRSARIFSLPDGTEQATLLGHTEALQSVAFSPDGTKVVTHELRRHGTRLGCAHRPARAADRSTHR